MAEEIELGACTALCSHLEEVLDSGEARLVCNGEDLKIIARMKLMSEKEFNYFQAHRPKVGQVGHYIAAERQWIGDSAYLLGTRLGRKPSELEIARDYHDKNAARFRVFYALKFPDRVDRPIIDRRAS